MRPRYALIDLPFMVLAVVLLVPLIFNLAEILILWVEG